MKHPSVFVFLLLVASVTVSCASPTSSTASPAPNSSILQPGDTLGDAVLKIAKDETAEPDVFTYCNPLITEADPRILVRTCNVPQLPYLFIGYGELANTQEELESLWTAKTWHLYFDEHAVDLESFGFFDVDWEEYRLRRWKIAVENLPPGEHSLHYISSSAKQQLLVDVIWVFTMGDSTAAAFPTTVTLPGPATSQPRAIAVDPDTAADDWMTILYLLQRSDVKSRP